MLRGNYPAKVDEKGRVKIPAAFLEALREYGNKFYVTSENGDYVRIYPMKIWNEIEEKLAQLSSHNRTKQKFLTRTNYYGQVVELDGQGRLLIPADPARVRADEGRRGRAGKSDLPRGLEPRAVPRELESQPDHGRRREDAGRSGHLVGEAALPRAWRRRIRVERGHTPVLAEEAVRWLRVEPGGNVPGRDGGAGRPRAWKSHGSLTTGRLIGIDRDAQALEIARERLKDYERQVTLVQADFSRIDEVVRELDLASAERRAWPTWAFPACNWTPPERGFSFRLAGPLDMRMDLERRRPRRTS